MKDCCCRRGKGFQIRSVFEDRLIGGKFLCREREILPTDAVEDYGATALRLDQRRLGKSVNLGKVNKRKEGNSDEGCVGASSDFGVL